MTSRDLRSDSVKFKTAQRTCLLPVNERADRSQETRTLQPSVRERSDPFRSGVSLRTSDFMAVNRERKINQLYRASAILLGLERRLRLSRVYA